MPRTTKRARRVVIVDNSAVARQIGQRVRAARLRASMTQAALAGERYTPAYISALERGLAKPSMAALTFVAERLNTTVRDLVEDKGKQWNRLSADLHLALEDWEGALTAYRDLVDAAADPHDHALIQRGMAEALCRLNRGEDAIGPAAEAAGQLEALGDVGEAALSRYWLAYAHFQTDNLEDARAILSELRSASRTGLQVQDDFRLRVLVASAWLEIRDSAIERAHAYLAEATAAAGNLDARRQATYWFSIAMQYQETRDYEAALRAGGKALALFEFAAADAEIASLKNTMAMALIEMGNLDRAADYVEQARVGLQNHPESRLHAHIAETRARLLLAKGELDGALESADLAERLGASVGNVHAQANAVVTAARILQQRGDTDKALDHYERAAGLLASRQLQRRRSEVLGEWAQLLADTGRHEEATRLFREALGPRRL